MEKDLVLYEEITTLKGTIEAVSNISWEPEIKMAMLEARLCLNELYNEIRRSLINTIQDADKFPHDTYNELVGIIETTKKKTIDGKVGMLLHDALSLLGDLYRAAMRVLFPSSNEYVIRVEKDETVLDKYTYVFTYVDDPENKRLIVKWTPPK